MKGGSQADAKTDKEHRAQVAELRKEADSLKKAIAKLGTKKVVEALKQELAANQKALEALDRRPPSLRLAKTEEALKRVEQQRTTLMNVKVRAEADVKNADKRLAEIEVEHRNLLEKKDRLCEEMALQPRLLPSEQAKKEEEDPDLKARKVEKMAGIALNLSDKAGAVMEGTINPFFLLRETLEQLQADPDVQTLVQGEYARRAQEAEYVAGATDSCGEDGDEDDADYSDVLLEDAEPRNPWQHRDGRGRARAGLASTRRKLRLALAQKVKAAGYRAKRR